MTGATRIHSQDRGRLWTREELILAFDLYCRIPFRKTKANNPLVTRLARALGRTPSSVARKLGNFGAFDPELKKRQITGLTHTGKLDKEVWDEFNSDWGALVLEAEKIRQKVEQQPLQDVTPPQLQDGKRPTERVATVKQRIQQDFFRASVLASYDSRCCVCGLPHLEILVASHIIPWSVREDTRVNPENGLCLCGSHDRAFDGGLVGIATGFKVECSTTLRNATDAATREFFLAYDGAALNLPHRFHPRPDFLQWHYSNVFIGHGSA